MYIKYTKQFMLLFFNKYLFRYNKKKISHQITFFKNNKNLIFYIKKIYIITIASYNNDLILNTNAYA